MEKREFTQNGEKWVRVSKRKAERLFDTEKKDIFFIPCNARLESPWGLGLIILPKNNTHTFFKQLCNEFEHYNCNSELGKRATFYVRESEVV